jgi:hypothetical protein
MYAQVTKVILTIISIANYVVFTCDEMNTMDNGGWVLIHAYVMQNWVRVPMLFSLQKVVDVARADNLIVVIMDDLLKRGS